MKFKCTCDEARAERIRLRLLHSALPYCFYLKLMNRPVFEFDSEDDMMRAVMASDGELMMLSSHVPPRAKDKLRLTPERSGTPPARSPAETAPRQAGLFAGAPAAPSPAASLRPAHLAKRAPAKRA